ncbi:conserved hypothetical protein [Ricinus communis]|uniref:Uncharacterized protein n=1 Tax=Ricinus communis TaxID=3988 RepID=B9SGE8_RICCO|nr:conserved hypothetical protein [Ricinus communis]
MAYSTSESEIITISPHLALRYQPTNTTLGESHKICSYSIEIETTCAPSADTKDHVSARFSDSSGNLIIVKHLKNPKLVYPPNGLRKQGGVYGGFGRCAVDMFEVSGPCMKQSICSLYLKKVGSDNWRPGWVKVLHQEGSNGHLVQVSYMFYFRRFLPENVWYGFDYCHSKEGFQPHVATFGKD